MLSEQQEGTGTIYKSDPMTEGAKSFGKVKYKINYSTNVGRIQHAAGTPALFRFSYAEIVPTDENPGLQFSDGDYWLVQKDEEVVHLFSKDHVFTKVVM